MLTLMCAFSNHDTLASKVFFANTSQFLALPSFRGTGPNVTGFGKDQTFNKRSQTKSALVTHLTPTPRSHRSRFLMLR